MKDKAEDSFPLQLPPRCFHTLETMNKQVLQNFFIFYHNCYHKTF